MRFESSKCYIPEPYDCQDFAGTKDLPSALPCPEKKVIISVCVLET
jgi:hypothetical protein